MKRASGILLPVFSLPSKYGIGCFSKEAYRFIDLLKKAGQSYWQILPLGPTGYGDSPYQSFSTYAGNPYYIDLKTLVKEGLLTKKECKAYDFGDQEECIDYEKIYKSMGAAGAASVAVGIIVTVTGIAAGVIAIVFGTKLIKDRKDLTF